MNLRRALKDQMMLSKIVFGVICVVPLLVVAVPAWLVAKWVSFVCKSESMADARDAYLEFLG
jgi:hypothetical protein